MIYTIRRSSVCLWHLRQWEPTRSRHGWVHLFTTHCLRLNLQLHTISFVRTCRISSFCTVASQLARLPLTRRIARALGDSWASCYITWLHAYVCVIKEWNILQSFYCLMSTNVTYQFMHDYIVKSSIASKIAQNPTHRYLYFWVYNSMRNNVHRVFSVAVYNYKSIRDNIHSRSVQMYEWVHVRASRNILRNVHRHQRRWQSSRHQLFMQIKYTADSLQATATLTLAELLMMTQKVHRGVVLFVNMLWWVCFPAAEICISDMLTVQLFSDPTSIVTTMNSFHVTETWIFRFERPWCSRL